MFRLPMRKLSSICATGLVIGSAAFNGRAFAEDKWMPLGEARTSSVSTSAYIPADTAKGTICSIRFKTGSGSLEVNQLTVHFGNSQTMHMATDLKFSSDVSSLSIALPGMRRTVKGVDIVYVRPDSAATAPTVYLSGNALVGNLICPK
jgi:hypothetical protein